MHVHEGVPQMVFVTANYSMEVRRHTDQAVLQQAVLQQAALQRSSTRGPHAQRCLTRACPARPALRLALPCARNARTHACACAPAQTSDAERIGVDQVAKILPSGKATGSEQREHARRVRLLCPLCTCCACM